MSAAGGAADCVFCGIVRGSEPASVVHADVDVVAFLDIRPVRRGQLVVVPRIHIDHFDELPEPLAARVLLTGHRLAGVLRKLPGARRAGMVVHGFGVAHAHLVVLPLEHPWDITAAQCASIEDGRVVFRWEALPLADRAELDVLAAQLAAALSRVRTWP